MELREIGLSSMWPDPNNPRKDFGDLDAMADTFELDGSPRPGEEELAAIEKHSEKEEEEEEDDDSDDE